ncbi:MAG: hypothetical protein ACXVY8_04615 [Gaiellaceae bacterium]
MALRRIVRDGWRRGRGALLVLSLLSVAAVSAVASGARDVRQALPPPRVTMVTDSVGGVLYWADRARAELAAGLDFRVEVKACRKLVVKGCYAYGENPPSALETIQALGAERDKLGTRLGRLVIVDVGYNDLAETYAAGLDTVMSALVSLGVQHVIWVTLDERQDVWTRINKEIRAATVRWPELVVADWAPVAGKHPEWRADPVHMNEIGAAAFARFLRPIVLATCGSACEPPPATTAAPAPAPSPEATLLPPLSSGRTVTIRWRGNDTAVSFDVAVRRARWSTVATALKATSFRVKGSPGQSVLARVRARDADGAAGPWSTAQSILFLGR